MATARKIVAVLAGLHRAWRPSLLCLLAVTCLLTMGQSAGAAQPAQGMRLAFRDIQAVSPSDRPYTRYLWFLEDDPKLKATTYQAVAGHVNFLSRSKRIVPPLVVLTDGTVAVGAAVADWTKVALVRLNILDYGWEASVWDRLGDPKLEPFFHVFTVVPYPAGRYSDGSYYAAGEEKVAALAPWLIDPLGLPADASREAERKAYREAAVGLVTLTDCSQAPIIEASNFIWQTAIQFDRTAGYYDFLGVKNQKTFDRLVGFDRQASLNFAYPLLEAVSESGVSQQPRRVEIWEKIGGRYILTKDQVNQRAQGARNPLLTKGHDDLKFDAQEIFASLPNGLWATGLFAADGTRQDSAPDGVGYHHFSVSNDGKIHVNLACIACHDRRPGNGGLQPFKPYFRNLYAAPGPLALADKSPFTLKVLADQYLTPIDVDGDRQRYVLALAQANGLPPDKYAVALYETFHRFDRPVDADRAAIELGVTGAELTAALGRQIKLFGTLDEVTANWLLAPARRQRIGRDQFAEVYNQAQLAIRGLPTWPPELRHKYPTKR